MITNKIYLPLILILVFGFCVRLPGVLWGVNIHAQPHFTGYHTDELDRVQITSEFLTGTVFQQAYYPKGYYFQNAIPALLLKPFIAIGEPQLILIGRLLSLIYGVLTIGLVYLITKEIFVNHLTAVYSSMFLAFSGLHVTASHYAVVDAGTVFFTYAAMYCSLLFMRRNRNIFLISALVLAAIGLAFKLSLYILIPLLYIMWKRRLRPLIWIGCFALICAVFAAANGGHYTWHNFILTMQNVQNDNISVITKYNKLWNPLIYFVGTIPALGFIGFATFLTGAFLLFKQKKNILTPDIFFIFILPLSVYGVSICCLSDPFTRHVLPFIVLFAIVAAYGLEKIQHVIPARRFTFLVSVIVFYQMLYVINFQYYYIFDTRASAQECIKEHVPKGKTIYLMRHAQMADLGQYTLVKDYRAEYLVMNEADYFRYKRSVFCPFKEYPDWDEVYHGKKEDFKEIQNTLQGKSSYRLIAQFPVRFITPENFIYKRILGTYTEEIGDTRIYQRNTLPDSAA